MGCYDGAEISEIIGLYLLHRLVNIEKIFGKEEVGIFRDDGLSVVRGYGHTIDKKRKDTIRVFKQEGLKLTLEVNVETVCFLDVMFDLKNENFKPYHKLNTELKYVDKGSNHPQGVLENIPFGINQRLSLISKDKQCFESEKQDFQEALNRAGYS